MATLEESLSAPPGLVTGHLPEFAARWGLDQESQQFLASLPLAVQDAVMAGFDPPPATRSVNAKLHAFARRLATEMGHPELGSRPAGGSAAPASNRATAVLPPSGPKRLQSWPSAGGLAEFVSHWGLDEGSEQMLRNLSPALVEEVLTTFDPDVNTRNVNAKLFAFVKARQGAIPPAGGGAPLGEDTVRQFAETWALDDTAMQMLRKLPPEVRSGVLADFSPPPDTQNVNAKLNAFVKGRVEKLGLPFPPAGGVTAWAAGPPPAGGRSIRPRSVDLVSAFVERWGCDAQCEAMLRQLQPEHQVMVTRDFDPPPGTYNINGKLNSFIRSVVSRHPSPGDSTESFAAHWGVDAEALQTLRNLPEELQSSIMAEFSPPAGTHNISGKLAAFIRAKLSAVAEGGGTRAPPRKRRGSDLDSEVEEFVAHWRLDNEALHLLHTLPADVLQGVMRDFQPRSDTWNPSGRFHAFVRRRLKEIGGDEASLATEEVPPWRTTRPAAEGATSYTPDGDEVGEFVARWGLDRSSEDLMRSLPEDIRGHVLASFEPQPNTRNRNAKLATWVRSLQTQTAGGDSKRPRLV